MVLSGSLEALVSTDKEVPRLHRISLTGLSPITLGLTFVGAKPELSIVNKLDAALLSKLPKELRQLWA